MKVRKTSFELEIMTRKMSKLWQQKMENMSSFYSVKHIFAQIMFYWRFSFIWVFENIIQNRFKFINQGWLNSYLVGHFAVLVEGNFNNVNEMIWCLILIYFYLDANIVI